MGRGDFTALGGARVSVLGGASQRCDGVVLVRAMRQGEKLSREDIRSSGWDRIPPELVDFLLACVNKDLPEDHILDTDDTTDAGLVPARGGSKGFRVKTLRHLMVYH